MYLNCHSYYSLRYGTLSPEELVKKAKQLKVDTLVLTDINNTTGIPDFVKICTQEGIHPIAGIEFRNDNTLLYVGIAKNNAGFEELNKYLSSYRLANKPLPILARDFENVFIIYPFESCIPDKLRENEFIGIRPWQIRKLFSSKYRYKQSQLVMLHSVTLADSSGYELHRHLRAIDNNILLSKIQAEDLAHKHEIFMPPETLLQHFADYPQIKTNTEELIAECSIQFDYKSLKNKSTFTGSRYDDKLLLEKLSLDGLSYRYGKNNKNAIKRIQNELQIINKLGFSSYFLITWDIIRYSMSRGFYHVGRGSGANSVVAFCLKITDVDPIELNLYFERFLNPKRTSPPDFDIDYSWKERDEVQEYIFKRYGSERTALLGAMSTFKGKSIVRELAKVYGLPKEEVDDFLSRPKAPQHQNDIMKKILHIGKFMSGFPNIRSIHAGGILISEKPITHYTSLDMPPKGFPTTQWDMYVAEDIGFEKLDILSQRGIGHIKESIDIIRANKGENIDAHEVEKFKTDPRVKKQLKEAETNGCFYIESPAMRGLLQKLKCDNYLTLVAASSIIRPGVAKSGMMREYIQRFHKPDKINYLHPVMKEQLEETFGVMVYQEDVIKICHHFAGLDLADADVLRRAMSGKYRSKKEFQRIVEKFFVNCKAKGYPEKLTKEVWRQIESFAGYSFSKAHSASYAVESFQSLYLKAHFPLEFMVSVINNFGGFYHTWVYFNEAKRCGATIHLPCMNKSEYKTTIYGSDIYIGLIHIASLENKIAQIIPVERRKRGDFQSLEDFINRIEIGLENLLLLIRVNAFRFCGKSKAQLLWEAHFLKQKKAKEQQERKNLLFQAPVKQFQLPDLVQTPLENAYDEIELLGFPVTLSYFDLLKTCFRGELCAKEMPRFIGRKVRMVGQLVTIKYVWTVKKEQMNFGTFIDNKGEFFDTVNFPPSLKNYPFKGSGIYLILGKIVEEFGFPSLEVEKMAKLPLKEDTRFS